MSDSKAEVVEFEVEDLKRQDVEQESLLMPMKFDDVRRTRFESHLALLLIAGVFVAVVTVLIFIF